MDQARKRWVRYLIAQARELRLLGITSRDQAESALCLTLAGEIRRGTEQNIAVRLGDSRS